MAEHILFDLDGTLIASEEGILCSAEYALEKMGLPCPGRDILKDFVGPPLLQSFEQVCGLDEKTALEAARFYRRRYGEKGIFEAELYPGIPELLSSLQKAGRKSHLATSKPIDYARQILRRFGILPFFSSVAGAPMELRPHTKAEVICQVLEEGGFAPKDALMVGDRRYDVEGAKACGMESVGVLYGYGTAEELQKAGAVRLAKDVQELGRILLFEP